MIRFLKRDTAFGVFIDADEFMNNNELEMDDTKKIMDEMDEIYKDNPDSIKQ